MAPRVGIEPTTNGLTVRRSTAELPGNGRCEAKGADCGGGSERRQGRGVKEEASRNQRLTGAEGAGGVTQSAVWGLRRARPVPGRYSRRHRITSPSQKLRDA